MEEPIPQQEGSGREISMRNKKQILGVCMLIPLIVGGVAAFLTKSSMSMWETMKKPPLSPPGWLFPVVWTLLYGMMGAASYLVVTSRRNGAEIRKAIFLYSLQLVVNFCWPIFFFSLGWYWFSFLWLLLLWYLILQTIFLFEEIRIVSAYLLLPYLIWVTFAGYLNAGIAFLN
jgi:tryptophan-rich sensory protein